MRFGADARNEEDVVNTPEQTTNTKGDREGNIPGTGVSRVCSWVRATSGKRTPIQRREDSPRGSPALVISAAIAVLIFDGLWRFVRAAVGDPAHLFSWALGLSLAWLFVDLWDWGFDAGWWIQRHIEFVWRVLP